MHAAAYLRRLALVAPFVVFAGCTVGPNYERPDTKVKGSFDAQRPFDPSSTQPSTKPTTQPIVSRWWTTFNDSQLDSLVDRAIVANLDVRQAQARVREARARVGVERSGYYPDVTAGASYSRSSRSLNIDGGTTGSGTGTGTGGGGAGGGAPVNFSPDRETDFWQAGFDAAWEVDVFGGTRRAVQAAVAELQAVEEERNDVLLTLLGDVANNYVQYRGIQQTILTTQANLKVQQDTLELTQSRFDAGLSSDLDVARAEAQVETTAAQLPPLHTEQRQYLHRLGVLLGQDPSALSNELAEVKPIPGSTVEVPIGLPSELLRRRPDIRRAERQLAAATARIGQAIAEYFPKFSLVGSLGLQSSEFSSWGDADSIFWNVGPSISWNLFSGGRVRSQVDVQNAIQEQAVSSYEQAVLTSLEDVENALTAFDREQSRRARLASAVKSNQRAVSLSQQLYERGLGDFLDVLQAQQALFNSQDALARSEAQVSANLVALYKALGGGWDEAAQQLSAAK